MTPPPHPRHARTPPLLVKDEPDEEMGTLAMIGYKVKLYSSMTKLQADMTWFNYMIKLKKRQFGIEVYKVRDEWSARTESLQSKL